MPGEATETVPVTEQEMQQPQVETGSYIYTSHKHACNMQMNRTGGPGSQTSEMFNEWPSAEGYLLSRGAIVHDGTVICFMALTAWLDTELIEQVTVIFTVTQPCVEIFVTVYPLRELQWWYCLALC